MNILEINELFIHICNNFLTTIEIKKLLCTSTKFNNKKLYPKDTILIISNKYIINGFIYKEYKLDSIMELINSIKFYDFNDNINNSYKIINNNFRPSQILIIIDDNINY